MNRARLAALALIALLAGLACASGPAPRDHFYHLVVPGPSGEGPALIEGGLEVERLRAAATTRGRALLHSRGDGVEVTPYRHHLWTDPPTLLAQREIARWLGARGVASPVTTTEMRAPAGHVLRGRIDRFEHRPDEGVVRIDVSLAITRIDPMTQVVHGRFAFDEPTEGDSPEAAAEALGRALGRALEGFVAQWKGA